MTLKGTKRTLKIIKTIENYTYIIRKNPENIVSPINIINFNKGGEK
jgi:hypothetical protein